MAGFLRKKTKQEGTKRSPSISSPVTLASSVPPPPLYAKFASTANASHDSQTAPKIVSSPMPITTQSRNQREAAGKGVGNGRYGNSSTSLAASRDAEMARRRAQEQAVAQPSMPRGGVYQPSTTGQPPTSPLPTMQPQLRTRPTEDRASRPISRVIMDKPLPLPAPPIDDGPARSVAPASPRVSRAPPPTFQTQQQGGTRSRASLDLQNRDSKPLPRPGSAQSFYAPSNYNFTPTPPAGRRSSVSVPSSQGGPPSPTSPRKIQPQPSSYVQKISPNPVGQTLPPLPPKGQGSPPGASWSAPAATHETPLLDQGQDLPSEFAVFQVSFVPLIFL